MTDPTPLLDIAQQLDGIDISDEEALAEESEEAGVLYTAAEVPQIIAQLRSEVTGDSEKATEALTSIATTQPDLLSSHITSLIPSLLAYIPQLNDESRRSALVDLLSQLGAISSAGSEQLKHKGVLENLLRMLRQSETMDKYSLVNLLEDLLERAEDLGDDRTHGALEGTLVDLLQRKFYELELGPSVEEEAEPAGQAFEMALGAPITAASNAIEVFELTLVLTKEHLRSASLKAGALEFLILTSITPTPSLAETMHSSVTAAKDLRVAAISCLAEVYSRIAEDELLPSDIPTLELEPNDKLKLRSLVVVPLLNIIDDKDELISDKAVEVLYGRINDEDRSVEQFFWAHEGSVERLVRKIALSGATRHGRFDEKPEHPKPHSLTEWLLSVLIQRDRVRLTEAFSSFWSDDGVERSVKKKLVRVLPSTLSDIQETAKSAGVGLGVDGVLE